MWSLVIGLVAFRLYRLTGIDDITEPLHGRINAAASRNRVASWIAELISCPWCIGLWFSAGAAAAGWHLDVFTPYEAVMVTLAGSTVCGLVARAERVAENLEILTRETTKRVQR